MLSQSRARKSDNFRKSNQEKKQRTDTKNNAKKNKSGNFTRSNTENIIKIAPKSFSPTVSKKGKGEEGVNCLPYFK